MTKLPVRPPLKYPQHGLNIVSWSTLSADILSAGNSSRIFRWASFIDTYTQNNTPSNFQSPARFH